MDKLTKEEIAQFHETFRLFDEDNNGSIDINELGKMIKKLGKQEVTQGRLEKLMADIDENKDGTVDFKEFCYLITRLSDKEGEDPEIDMKKAFQHFDKDKNGTIETSELKELFSNLGLEADDEAIQDVIKLIDSNGDGVIDFPEFRKAYIEMSLKGKINLDKPAKGSGKKVTRKACCVVC